MCTCSFGKKNKIEITYENVVNQSIYQITVVLKITSKRFKGVLLRLKRHRKRGDDT